ncbi:MAG: XrtA/PEP-CTERM system histidine kinase PrsK [Nitrospirota bacterium]
MSFVNIISIFSILASVIVALFMFAKNRKGLPNIAFALGMLSIGAIEFGDLMTFREPHNILLYKKVSLIAESLLPGLWLLFGLTYSRKDYKEIAAFWKVALFISVLPFLFAISLPLNLFFYSPDIEIEKMMFLSAAGYYFYLFILLYAVLTLINLEGTLKSSSGSIRWRIKHTLIGVGGIMSSVIYYYSKALLYRSIDMNLSPVRGSIVIISSLLIMISIFRQTFPKEEISISRGIFYRSFTLLIAGVYLLGLGIMGAGMKYLGENFGRYLSIVIVFGGTIALITVLFSETLRRRVKVFIDKNFYKDKYDYRSQWLQFTQRISYTKTFDELLSAILDGFASAMGSRTKSLWLYNNISDIFYQAQPYNASSHGITLKGSSSLISYFKEKGWIFNANDKDNKILEENKEFFERTNASLVIPLMNNGNIIGFIELGKSLSNDIYNYEDYDFLKTLAKQAISAIMNARLTEELTKAREMEAIGRVSSFVIHDLKNLVSTLSLSVENAPDNINNPEFQKDMLNTLSNTVDKMKGLIKKLSDMPKKAELNLETLDIVPLVKGTVKPFLNGKTKVEVECPEQLISRIDSEEIKKVIINLVLNAVEATNVGTVNVKISTEDSMACITVSDNGCGMSEEYIEKYLFKPFYTTKKKGLGIGLYQCKSIVEAHKGDIQVRSIEGKGTDFMVYLPIDY